MKSLLFILLLISSILKADTHSVDENMFDWGLTIPMEFTYLNQNEGGHTYLFNPTKMGVYLSYERWELHTQVGYASGLCYFESTSLENHDSLVAVSYGSSLLYHINRRVQTGIYVNKTSFFSESNSQNYENGDLIDYGIKFVYNPNKLRKRSIKRSFQMHYTLSLGYTDGKDINSVSSELTPVPYRLGNTSIQRYEMVTIRKKIDLSGTSVSFGILLKI